MASVVGFNFTKVLAERKTNTAGKVNINTNVSLRDIEEASINLDPKQKSVRVKFHFSTAYQPGLGHISLDGDLILLLPAKDAKDMLDLWREKRQIGKDFAKPVLNNILSRCSVQALTLSKDLGLPPPVRLPSVELKETQAPSPKGASKKKSVAKAKKATKK
ncbi:hypothetical protein D6783_01405 [Candidatus Woesearchaeota archaeon]|nr:MAG: hypothetical protein D6783_01405 [Candidatus Woesearchaeota archaeon]